MQSVRTFAATKTKVVSSRLLRGRPFEMATTAAAVPVRARRRPPCASILAGCNVSCAWTLSLCLSPRAIRTFRLGGCASISPAGECDGALSRSYIDDGVCRSVNPEGSGHIGSKNAVGSADFISIRLTISYHEVLNVRTSISAGKVH